MEIHIAAAMSLHTVMNASLPLPRYVFSINTFCLIFLWIRKAPDIRCPAISHGLVTSRRGLRYRKVNTSNIDSKYGASLTAANSKPANVGSSRSSKNCADRMAIRRLNRERGASHVARMFRQSCGVSDDYNVRTTRTQINEMNRRAALHSERLIT